MTSLPPWTRRAGLRVLAACIALAAACSETPAAPDGAPAPDAADGAAPDAPDAADAPAMQDGDDLGDRLLCEATCARQDRPLCALFDRDRCVRDCVAQVMALSARCRPQVELWLRCRASGASFVCDDRGEPATADCAEPTADLAACVRSDPDAGDAAADAVEAGDVAPDLAPDVAPDATDDVAPDLAPDAAPDATDAADDATDAAPDDATAAMDADDATAPMDAPDVAPTDAPDVAPADAPDASPPDGPTSPCAAPVGTITMPGAEVAREATTSGASALNGSMCRPDTDGPEHVYRLDVTARTGLVIDTEGARTAFDTVLSVRRTCDDVRTEVTCDDDSGRDNTALVRAIVDPGTYHLVVDGAARSAGAYALRVRSFTPAANALCAGALALAPGATLTNQGAAAGGLRADHCRPSATGGPLFYAVAVPAMSRVTVRATPTGPAWTPLLGATTSCASRACVAQSAGEAAGTPSALTLVNSGTAAATYYVSVANAAASDGAFDLSASAATSFAAGATCTTALLLTPGTPRTAQDLAPAFQPGAALCLSGFTQGQLYYILRVPSRQRGTVTVTPRASPAMAPVVRVLRGACASTSCESNAQAPAGAPTSVSYDNPDASSIDVIVTVTNALGPGGLFDIASTTAAIPAGSTCPTPAVLSTAATATGNTLTGTRAGAELCEPTATGPQLYYQLSIPAGQRGTVTVTPTGTPLWRPLLRVLDNCLAATCRLAVTAPSVGEVARASVDNNGAAAVTVTFAVTGSGSPMGGAAVVSAALSPATPAPYAQTTIPVACDAVGTATLVAPADGWDDDTATDVMPLPFNVAYFGAAATHYSVSSNGYLQLWPSAAGEAAITERNVAFPTVGEPDGTVAPFWDDLIPFDETTDVRVATLGTSPRRRFVVQWTRWQVVGDTASDLTFQAKLFEGTNAVEFHYCTITPARTLPLGAAASIGLESLDGRDGVTTALNRLNAVDPTNAFRYTPR
ncbi:MAG: hypothetical protein U0324_12060 [Polyangiales bacterium]